MVKERIVAQGHGNLNPTLFCVHSTANPGATAQNHADYWSRNGENAVHLVSDWTECLHCVPYDRLCWQVGNGNAVCEGIEICEATNAEDFKRGIDIAAEAVAERLNAHGWTTYQMRTHKWFSENYGGSDHTDPIPYFDRYRYSWEDFVNLVDSKLRKEAPEEEEDMAAAIYWFNGGAALRTDNGFKTIPDENALNVIRADYYDRHGKEIPEFKKDSNWLGVFKAMYK